VDAQQGLTAEQRQEIAERITRASRFTYAKRRIQKILDAWPVLTEEQRQELALILWPGDEQ
jgi:hypothetical protein